MRLESGITDDHENMSTKALATTRSQGQQNPLPNAHLVVIERTIEIKSQHGVAIARIDHIEIEVTNETVSIARRGGGQGLPRTALTNHAKLMVLYLPAQEHTSERSETMSPLCQAGRDGSGMKRTSTVSGNARSQIHPSLLRTVTVSNARSVVIETYQIRIITRKLNEHRARQLVRR